MPDNDLQIENRIYRLRISRYRRFPLSVTGSRSSGGIAYRLFFDLEPGAVYDYDESRSRSEAAVVCAGFG